MLDNLRESLPVLLDLLQYVAYVLGVLEVGVGTGGLIKLSTDPRSINTAKPIGELAVGGIMMSNSAWLPLVISSFTSDYESTANILSYLGNTGGASPMAALARTVVAFAQFLGVIAIVKGWHLMKKATNSQSQHHGEDAAWAGFWHLAFGAAAANMNWTLQLASWFFGFPLPSFLT